jgi:hypothetical protein
VFPRYDRETRTLWFGGEIIKQFRQPAPDQETILMGFEEEGWRRRIDDPLPGNGRDPKARLHKAIGNLNRNQRRRLIRFRGDGTGQGILWEPVEE